MENTIILSRSIPQIGYVARTCTQGEEFDMVNLYIETLIQKYSNCKTKHAAIFIEPQIDTGYPDIVIVEYYVQTLPKPDTARKKLSTTDLKILYYIHQKKHLTLQNLSITLGYSLDEVRKSVQRLADANLIYLSRKSESVRNRPLSKYCPIKRIISIEAKLDKWNDAIIQAEHNVWFATDSYILVKKEKCSPSILKKCKEKGIGVILVNGNIKTVLSSSTRKFPVSYASLQFNEWLCKYFHFQEEC